MWAYEFCWYLFGTGLTWENVAACVSWMAPFMVVVSEREKAELKDFRKVPTEDRHNIQTHTDYLAMLVSHHSSHHTHSFTVNPYYEAEGASACTWAQIQEFASN